MEITATLDLRQLGQRQKPCSSEGSTEQCRIHLLPATPNPENGAGETLASAMPVT
jgi:hypothetical protein